MDVQAKIEALLRKLVEGLCPKPEVQAVDLERDEFDAYALIREVAEKYPVAAHKAVCDGVDAQYRGDHPFSYPLKDVREDRGRWEND
jgi:hypothetical protein